MIAYLLGIIAGFATPTQTSVNGKLREKIGSPYLTSVVSFAGATLIMLIIVLVGGEFNTVPIVKILDEPLWIWGGGVCGAAIVMLNMLCLPKLGSAKTVMFLSFGQIMTSLIIDNFGIFRVPIIEITCIRIVGACVALLGVIIVSYDKSIFKSKIFYDDRAKSDNNKLDNNKAAEKRESNLIYGVGAALCGTCCATQVAINGTLRTVLESGTVTTLISMGVGLITIAILTAILFIIQGKQGVFNSPKGEFEFKTWMITGGFFAIVIVLSNSITAPILGAGLVTIMNLIGQMSAGLVYDSIGFLGIKKRPIEVLKVIGMTVIVIGAVMITLV